MGPKCRKEFEPVTGRYWRLHTLKANHYPAIAEWELFDPQGISQWQACHTVAPEAFQNGIAEVEIDLSKHIKQPGQFLLRLDDPGTSGITVEDLRVSYDGHAVHEEVLSPVKGGEIYLLNRHAQVVEESRIVLKVRLRTKNSRAAQMTIAIKSAL